jgi:acyl-CoA reductase-like NAD-dependent aldehyde dehydrogenase
MGNRVRQKEQLSITGSGRNSKKTADFRTGAVVVVHTLAHAVGGLRAAVRAGRPITLLSAPDGGMYAGPGWFGALVDAAGEVVPDACFAALLDCGDEPGAALAAIRAGIDGVIFTGPADVARRLADIAAQHGVRLVTGRPAAGLDLVDDFFASIAESEQACAGIFAGSEPSG